MNDQPIVTLKKLIQQYGEGLVSDSRRTEALLNDHCPAYRREVFVLINAQREQIPIDLIATPGWMPLDAAESRLSRRLQSRLGLSVEAAEWAVRAWSVALGLQQNPSRTARFLGTARAAFVGLFAEKQQEPPQTENAQVAVQSSQATTTPQDAYTLTVPSPAKPATASGVSSAAERLRGASVKHVRRYAGFAALIASVALVWGLATATPAWDVAASVLPHLPGSSSDARHEYPVPRYATVSAGPLLVRTGPSMSDEYISTLPAGERVRVTEYSPDLEWSHIREPMEGWVNNWYLNFVPSDNADVKVRLLRQELVTAGEGVPVFAAPGAINAPVAILDPGEPALTIAQTTDGQWRHITNPVVGWVRSDGLAPQ